MTVITVTTPLIKSVNWRSNWRICESARGSPVLTGRFQVSSLYDICTRGEPRSGLITALFDDRFERVALGVHFVELLPAEHRFAIEFDRADGVGLGQLVFQDDGLALDGLPVRRVRNRPAPLLLARGIDEARLQPKDLAGRARRQRKFPDRIDE